MLYHMCDLRIGYKAVHKMLINNLKLVMEQLGMEQSELAKRTGLSRKTINFIANDRQGVNLETAYIIAEALGLSVYDIWILK
jgi:DNA-binding XRE family transcriptional regulator